MVMDLTPSPQCVGREFVRQYYTLLNKAPAHVHRFYNNNSSFVHGGLDTFNREEKPAVGQKQIHQCIQQLNFRDCHAKITQVDSQATLGNGVVVQVTGELSNGGQPMRRFTQTFVLGAQSPKQYYVHNDIFRYQDLVFGDEETEPETHHFEPEEEEPEHPQAPEMPGQVVVQQVAQLEAEQYFAAASAPPMTTMNGAIHMEEAPTQPQEPIPPATPTPLYNEMPQQQHVQNVPFENNFQTEDTEPEVEEELVCEEVITEEKPISSDDLDQQHPPNDIASSNEPKTYATLVKSGGATNNTSPSALPKSSPSPPPAMNRVETRPDGVPGVRGGMRARGGPPRGGMGGRPSVRSSPPEDNRDNGGQEETGQDGDRRRSVTSQPPFADEHQLFLGNLPHNATEQDLWNLFHSYGKINDLRIMNKSGMKGISGNKVPSYGFITFDNIQAVQAVLSSRPIFFPGDNSVKLNVEEKKTKPRMEGGRGGVRPPPMGGMRGPLPRGGQRGGFSRGGGGMQRGGGFSQRGGGIPR